MQYWENKHLFITPGSERQMRSFLISYLTRGEDSRVIRREELECLYNRFVLGARIFGLGEDSVLRMCRASEVKFIVGVNVSLGHSLARIRKDCEDMMRIKRTPMSDDILNRNIVGKFLVSCVTFWYKVQVHSKYPNEKLYLSVRSSTLARTVAFIESLFLNESGYPVFGRLHSSVSIKRYREIHPVSVLAFSVRIDEEARVAATQVTLAQVFGPDKEGNSRADFFDARDRDIEFDSPDDAPLPIPLPALLCMTTDNIVAWIRKEYSLADLRKLSLMAVGDARVHSLVMGTHSVLGKMYGEWFKEASVPSLNEWSTSVRECLMVARMKDTSPSIPTAVNMEVLESTAVSETSTNTTSITGDMRIRFRVSSSYDSLLPCSINCEDNILDKALEKLHHETMASF
jgi:hypothetical protein